MLTSAGIKKTMNSLQLSFMFLILSPHAISFGRCDHISFSICWMSKADVLERKSANLWLNDTAVKSIRKVGKVTSLTVSPGVENKLTLQYGGSVRGWTLSITPGTTFTKVRGQQKPLQQPISNTKGFQDVIHPTEVFACENGTLFFHQDENFFLAFGYTARLPVRLQSRTASDLLVSWVEAGSAASGSSDSHAATLYHSKLGSYRTLSTDTTTSSHYSFTALDSCSPYVACVEIAGTHSVTCLSTITDPDAPTDFEVTSWNSSSISLAWASRQNRKFSLFLLTTFYLNGTDHVTEEVPLWHKDSYTFTVSDLQPCTRVRFGLQTVCQAGMESRYSKMVLNAGNSLQSNVEGLCQTSYGPDNYTLSWEVRNTSSISMFRVYHEGLLQGTTLVTSYTVGRLLPCQEYQARVEALCGDSVVMSAKTVTAHTGLHGVSELRYRSNDSTALWMSSLAQRPAMAFLYELSLENGTTIRSSRVTDTELHLPGLEESKSYILDVWEQCDGEWESARSRLCFEGANSSMGQFMRSAGRGLRQDDFSMGLTVIMPWPMPEDLQDDASEPRATVERIFKDESHLGWKRLRDEERKRKELRLYKLKLENLFKDFDQPIHIELAYIEPAADPDKTEIAFMSFAALETENVLLPVEDQLDYIRSLNTSNITVKDLVVHWDGPDLCASSKETVCPSNSLCINTLGSYTCVCRHGYYDVSSFVKPPVASVLVCNEKGLFSQCLDKLVTGGIAKPYLTSHMGGKVDVKLNDGQCTVDEQDMFYYFRVSRKAPECGTERQVNETHIAFQNTLTVALSKEEIISRRDLKIIWKCVYPRHYARNTQVSVGMEWLSTFSLVEFSLSQQLGLTLTLYTDESYTRSYKSAVQLGNEDALFFQVALQTNGTFASDVLLQVETCWATESPDPEDRVQGVLLQDGCPVDSTFHWLSVNGLTQESRFSVQMFSMPQRLPLYIHCLTNICGHDEDCAKNCDRQQRTQRSVSQMDRRWKRAAVVSAGPVVVNKRGVPPSSWAEHMTVIFIVAGSIGFLLVTVLFVSAAKAIMTYYERLRLQCLKHHL